MVLGIRLMLPSLIDLSNFIMSFIFSKRLYRTGIIKFWKNLPGKYRAFNISFMESLNYEFILLIIDLLSLSVSF